MQRISRRYLRTLGGKLRKPSFSAHSVELASLRDEVCRGVHLFDVSLVHDNDPVNKQGIEVQQYASGDKIEIRYLYVMFLIGR